MTTNQEKLEALMLKHANKDKGLNEAVRRAMGEAYELGWVHGGEMQRVLLRLRLGLAVPTDGA